MGAKDQASSPSAGVGVSDRRKVAGSGSAPPPGKSGRSIFAWCAAAPLRLLGTSCPWAVAAKPGASALEGPDSREEVRRWGVRVLHIQWHRPEGPSAYPGPHSNMIPPTGQERESPCFLEPWLFLGAASP